MSAERVVLAYSGDVRSSVALAWLLEHVTQEVATVTLDVGQGRNLNDVRDRALGIGAIRAHVIDVRDAFARETLVPAWRLPYDEPKVAALARPIIARQTITVAGIEGADAVAHGSDTPDGLDAVLRAVAGRFEVLAPARDWPMDAEGLSEFCRTRGIPMPTASTHDVRTLWGRVYTGEPTRPTGEWAKEPSTIDITFARGVPVSLNGVTMPLPDLIVSLETIAGAHGIGRLEFPATDQRLRTIEEAPASVVLVRAIDVLGGGDGSVRATCAAGGVTLQRVG